MMSIVRKGVMMLPAALLGIIMLAASGHTAAEKNAIYYNKQGWQSFERGETLRAIVNFKNALKQNPRYKEALIGLGRAYVTVEAYDESIKLFTDALRLERDNLDAQTGMGFCMVGLGRYDDALKYFTAVAERSEGNLDARYGMARVYYLMDRRIWARRKLEGIFRVNPYHYPSLLLMADIKADDNRLDDAKKYIDKAIDTEREKPDAYVRAGRILYRYYLREDNRDYLVEAIDEFERALALQPDDINANRGLGFIYLVLGRYDEAVARYEKSIRSLPGNGQSYYNLGLAYERSGNTDGALDCFVRAMSAAPSDALVRASLEDTLVLGDYKIGHPQRVRLGNEHYQWAQKRMREKMSDDAILHLRRAVYLNPLQKEPHEMLRDYYATLNYHWFYINEIKDLLTMYPDEGYQDALNIAVIRRRNKLYAREGYAEEPPHRDVPRVLVLDLWSSGDISPHPNTGEMLASYLGFALGQFGRQEPFGLKRRREIMSKLKHGEGSFGDNLETLQDMFGDGSERAPGYIVFGDCREGEGFIMAQYRIMDFKTGVVIDEFTLSESGRESLSRLSLRAARRIYGAIPYEGRILKIDEKGVLVNLGTFDGLDNGDMIVNFRYESSPMSSRISVKRKLLFAIEEADTLVSYARPVDASVIDVVEVNDPVYPLQKRRAKRLE